MSEPADDTPQPAPAPTRPTPRHKKPGSYYYDDGTGYEIYNPAEAEEETDTEAQNTEETSDTPNHSTRGTP